MHTVIDIVVEARDEESAVSAAELYFELHLYKGNGGPFDYCSPMREGGRVSGSDRWTEYQDEPAAYSATSEKGQEEIQNAWDATVSHIEQDLQVVFDVAGQCETAEEFAQAVLDGEHNVVGRMSNATGSSADHKLYFEDWYASGVVSNRGWSHLQDRLYEESSSDQDEDLQLWVVPLDTHI